MHHDIQKIISYHDFYLFFPICKWKEFELFQLLESLKKNVLMHRPSIKKSLTYHTSELLLFLYLYWKYYQNTHLELPSSQYESARAKSCNLVKWWHFLLTLKTTKGWNFCCRLHMQCATIFRDDNIAPASGIIYCTFGHRRNFSVMFKYMLLGSILCLISWILT